MIHVQDIFTNLFNIPYHQRMMNYHSHLKYLFMSTLRMFLTFTYYFTHEIFPSTLFIVSSLSLSYSFSVYNKFCKQCPVHVYHTEPNTQIRTHILCDRRTKRIHWKTEKDKKIHWGDRLIFYSKIHAVHFRVLLTILICIVRLCDCILICVTV